MYLFPEKISTLEEKLETAINVTNELQEELRELVESLKPRSTIDSGELYSVWQRFVREHNPDPSNFIIE